MADEAIVVGAKDEASAILRKVEQQTQQLAQGVEKMAAETVQQGKRMEVAFKGIESAAKIITAIIAAVKVATAAFTGAQASVEAFNQQEAAVNGLRTALEAQGVVTEAAIERHVRFANSVQASTNVGDEATLGLMRQAAMMGVSDDQLQDVTLAAIGLSQALGISLDEALKKVVQATNGNAAAMGELIPGVRAAATEEERLAQIMAVANNGLQDAQNQTETTAGAMARASGAMGDLAEKVGAIIAPFQRFIAEGVAVFAEAMQTQLQPAIEFMNQGMANLRPILDAIIGGFQAAAVVIGVALETALNLFNALFAQVSGSIGTWEAWGDTIDSVIQFVAKAMIAGFTMLEVILTNFPATLTMVGLQTELMFVSMAENAKWALTVGIPAYFAAFLGINQQWAQNLLTGMVGAMEKLAEVLLSPFRLLQKVLPSVLDGVLEGVKTSLSQLNVAVEFAAVQVGSLPTMAGRELSAREQELQGQIGAIATDLGDQFNERYQERVAQLGASTRERLQQDLQLTSNAVEQKAEEIAETATAAATKNVSGMTQSLSAVESRLLTRGSSSDPIQTVADNTKATVDALKTLAPDIAANLRDFMIGNQTGMRLEVIG